jgi:FAD synthase
LFFVGKIREEQKFQGIDQLKAQLMLDQNSALAILSKEDLQ